MISFKGFDVYHYTLTVTRHAFKRADERAIELDMLYQTVYNGTIERFGKNGIKFIKEGKQRIICVGEIKGDQIKILTVEK
jgi:hypothetical protein